MQHRSTFAGQRNPQRNPRKLSPINAAQRAGYMLDTPPAAPALPAAKTGGKPSVSSTATKPH
jgi:hypothetical protein